MTGRADRRHYTELLLPRTAPSGEHTPLAGWRVARMRAGNLEHEQHPQNLAEGRRPAANSFKDRASSMVVAQAIATNREQFAWPPP